MLNFPILYICIILFFIFCGILLLGGSHKKKNLYVFICISILATLGAFRGTEIGNDTETYIALFQKLDSVDISYALTTYSLRYEIGLIILIKILQIFTHNPQSLLIISSAIIWFSIYKFISKRSKEPILSCILIICFSFMAFYFSAIRASLAFAFILNAYDSISNKRVIKALCLLLFAFLFHRTSLVFLIALPIYYWKPNKKTLAFMFTIALFVFWQFDYFLEKAIELFPTYIYYADSEYVTGGVKLATILNILVMVGIFLLGTYLTKHNNINVSSLALDNYHESVFMRNLIFVSILIMILSLKFNLLDRCAQYFTIFSIIYLPNCIVETKIENEKKIIYIMIVLVLFVAYFLVVQIIRPEWNHIFPYHFFWEY